MKKNQKPPLSLEELFVGIYQILIEIRDAMRQKFPKDEILIDQADAKKRLNLGDSALYRLRVAGKIPFTKIGGKIYYPLSFFTQAFNS